MVPWHTVRVAVIPDEGDYRLPDSYMCVDSKPKAPRVMEYGGTVSELFTIHCQCRVPRIDHLSMNPGVVSVTVTPSAVCRHCSGEAQNRGFLVAMSRGDTHSLSPTPRLDLSLAASA